MLSQLGKFVVPFSTAMPPISMAQSLSYALELCVWYSPYWLPLQLLLEGDKQGKDDHSFNVDDGEERTPENPVRQRVSRDFYLICDTIQEHFGTSTTNDSSTPQRKTRTVNSLPLFSLCCPFHFIYFRSAAEVAQSVCMWHGWRFHASTISASKQYNYYYSYPLSLCIVGTGATALHRTLWSEVDTSYQMIFQFHIVSDIQCVSYRRPRICLLDIQITDIQSKANSRTIKLLTRALDHFRTYFISIQPSFMKLLRAENNNR